MSQDATSEALGEKRDKLAAMDAALAAHPGSILRRRLEDLHRVWHAWAAFSAELYALLEVCETHEPTARELTRNVGDRTVQQNTIRALDKAVIAYAAGLGALIDQTRIVVQQQPDTCRSSTSGGERRRSVPCQLRCSSPSCGTTFFTTSLRPGPSTFHTVTA